MWDFIVGNHTDLISIYKVFEFEDPNRFLMQFLSCSYEYFSIWLQILFKIKNGIKNDLFLIF